MAIIPAASMDTMRDAEPDPVPHLALVTLTDSPIAGAVADRLAKLFPQSKLSQHSDPRRAAEDDPAAIIVLAVTSPIEAVARRLAEGAGARDALADWIAETAPSLAVARRHRRRLWLIDARAMAAGLPHALSAASAQAEAAGPDRDLPAPPAAIYLVLSDSLIARHEPARRLAAEIVSLCRGPQGVTVDLPRISDALGDDHDTRHQMTRVQADCDRLAAEADLLRENLAQQLALIEAATAQEAAQADLPADQGLLAAEIDLLRENLLLQLANADVAAKMRATLRDEVVTLSAAAAERHFFKSEAEALARRLEGAEETRLRREAVLGTLLLVDQAKLATQAFKEADLAARVSAAERESAARGERIVDLEAAQEAERLKAEAFDAELQRVFASNSWKVTGPLRVVRLWLGPKTS